jgi:hypothetical protein
MLRRPADARAHDAVQSSVAAGRKNDVTENVREHLDRILAAYEDISGRFGAVGGIAQLLGLFEDVKRELERVSDHELERVTGEIKSVVEDLLKVDYELRKVQNLKLLFEQRKPVAAPAADKDRS